MEDLLPKNSVRFYAEILRVIRNMAPESKHIRADFYFEYFNTSSAKCIFDLFKVLKEHKHRGLNVIVNWQFEEEDEDMREIGEDYESLLGIEFSFVPTFLELV